MREALAGRISVGQVVTLVSAIAAAGALGVFHDGHQQLAEASLTLHEVEQLERTTARGQRCGRRRRAAPTACPRGRSAWRASASPTPAGASRCSDKLDLTIEAGRSLAIVGDNGAGKTTLVKLLARLYDPGAGRITVDGIDLRQIDPAQWHRRVAAIFQDFVQFELTARDNVAFGALHRRDDAAAVALAAEQAGAAPIVAGLSQGWNTPLGRQFSNGAELSGGQWQRLALARALFAVRAGRGAAGAGRADGGAGRARRGPGVRPLPGAHPGHHHHRHLPPLLHRAPGRSHRGAGARPGGGGRHPRPAGRAGGRYATMYRLQAARFQAAPDQDGGAAE